MTSAPRLSARSAALLVVASMIGAGVFTTSGFALSDLTPRAVLLAWLVGGVVATLGALSYGALGARFPHSGGEYELLRRTVHPSAGAMAGWVSLLAGFSAPTAFAAASFGKYVAPLLGSSGADSSMVLGTAAILAAGGLHLGGLRLGARVQDGAVLVKTALILLLIVAGVVALLGGGGVASASADGAGTGAAPTAGWLAAFATTCVYVSFSYSGWNAAVYVAGEVDAASRNVPRAMLFGTGLVMLCYVGLNAVFVWSTDRAALAGQVDIGRLAANALFGEWAGFGVSLIVALALLTSISAMTMVGPRVYARMAQDGAMPRVFAVGDAHRPAVLLQLAVALTMLWTATFEGLLGYIGYTLGLSTAATVVGLMLVRCREGAARVPVWGWPVVPALYVTAVLGVSAFSFLQQPGPALAAFATLAVGGLADWRLRRPGRTVD